MKIFREVQQERQNCNFGCPHAVTINEVVEVEEVFRVKKQIMYGDVDCGWGYDTFYRDYFGNLYFTEDTWDGPSQILIDPDHNFWYKRRPHGFDAFMDTHGNYLNRNGEIL